MIEEEISPGGELFGIAEEVADVIVTVAKKRKPIKNSDDSGAVKKKRTKEKPGIGTDRPNSSLSTSTIPVEKDEPKEVDGFTRDRLVEGIRNKRYKKVAFLTGAGISVAAGIPDFRTPKIGLYAQLKEFGLPHPEEIFSLEFLLHSPVPFYAVANRYLQYKAKPALAHHFIKKFVDQKTLMLDYTQNIDGLELDVGIPPKLLVQAHGHMRSAHCSEKRCRAEADMKIFSRHVSKEEVMYCKECKTGIVKPDIVFFGEKLPKQFNQKFDAINNADLVFIMGTSLKVQPFSTLLTSLPTSTPLVVLNYTDPTATSTSANNKSKAKGTGSKEATAATAATAATTVTPTAKAPRENFLLLLGDIEQSVAGLMRDIGWTAGDKERSGDSAGVSKKGAHKKGNPAKAGGKETGIKRSTAVAAATTKVPVKATGGDKAKQSKSGTAVLQKKKGKRKKKVVKTEEAPAGVEGSASTSTRRRLKAEKGTD
jgi:NAD-dependent SIR2 family protein deacetylase